MSEQRERPDVAFGAGEFRLRSGRRGDAGGFDTPQKRRRQRAEELVKQRVPGASVVRKVADDQPRVAPDSVTPSLADLRRKYLGETRDDPTRDDEEQDEAQDARRTDSDASDEGVERVEEEDEEEDEPSEDAEGIVTYEAPPPSDSRRRAPVRHQAVVTKGRVTGERG